MSLDRIVAACTGITGMLVIGRLDKSGKKFLDKRSAEPEIMNAVVRHMIHDAPDGASKTVSSDNGKTWFRITVEPMDEQESNVARVENLIAR